MIVLVATFDFPSSSNARVLELARQMDVETNAEPGCLHYRHALDVSDPQRLILSEVWRDADALRAHFRSPHFAAFRHKARELGIRSRVIQYEASEVAADSSEYWKALLPPAGAKP
jgi:quinol monooxygenase YgiN